MKMPSGAGMRTWTPAKARLSSLKRRFRKAILSKPLSTLSFFIFLQNYAKTLFVVPVVCIPEKLSEIAVASYEKKNLCIVI